MPNHYDHDTSDSPEAISYALRSHIDSGLLLLGEGDGLSAYNHFQSSYEVPGLDGIDVRIGMVFPITSLLSDDDVIYAASTIASHSRAYKRGAEIGGWHTGDWNSDFNDTDKYLLHLVRKFHEEVGMIAAEEWLHILQATTGAPIAGQDDKEVDVAAYLTSTGLDLSVDFITRYSSRISWYLEGRPEHRKDILDFCKQFGRIALMSSAVGKQT